MLSGVILTLCLFSRIIIVNSPLKTMTCLSTSSRPHQWHQVWVSSYGAHLRSIQKTLVTPVTPMTLLHQGLSGQTSHYCGLQGSQLGETDGFSPLIKCIASTSTTKASQQRQSLQVVPTGFLSVYDSSTWCHQQWDLTIRFQEQWQ